MVKFVTAKLSISAVAAAALVAGLMAFSTSGAPEANAGSLIEGAVHQSHTKGDRLPRRVTGAPCSAHSWPNYDQACRFDLRQPANEVGTVRRIIALR